MMLSIPIMTVLVTGAGGYLGNELLKLFSSFPNLNVFALTSKPEKLKRKFKHMRNLTCYSLLDLEADKLPFSDVDFIIHSAFARSQDCTALAESLIFLEKIVERAIKNNVKGLVNISSQEVYGKNKNLPWLESDITEPNTVYGLAKLSSEIFARIAALGCNTRISNIRLAALVGPEANRIVSKFVKNAILGNPIEIFGGDQIFSFMDVRDAAEGLLQLLRVDCKGWSDTYNLGSRAYSILELAAEVKGVGEKLINKSVAIKVEEDKTGMHASLDSNRFYRDTKWKPKHGLSNTVSFLFEYYLRKNGV